MRITLFAIYVLAISCSSFAQSDQASWANLSQLKVGQKIQVVEITSKKHSGTFESVSGSAIALRDAAGEASVQKQDVRSVTLVQSNRRLRNTLIGLGVGAGAGAGITAAAWESHGFAGGKGIGAAFGAAVGGLGGIIVGALLPTHGTVYKAPSR